ncbi:transient receptor potential protein-like [Periplaneta americana]|uniref:transient receptor potential protein-like n=1 Tax=Periplaneta americana TaxID=6978 RepID=UPI0037E900BE
MKVTESKENLLSSESIRQSRSSLQAPPEYPLSQVEKQFLMYAERGDCANVKSFLEQFKDSTDELDINCVDPLNRSALIAAIENENIELIKILLEWKIQVKDALLHAIKEEYVEGVELLLEWEEKNHTPGQPYSWEAVDSASSTFTPDITPLILAAHKNNYEILKILLDRGATLPVPHDARCACDECVTSNDLDSLRHSQSRINAYRALTSPSLISLSSKDPLLTAFELSWELRRLSRMENEFRDEYNQMRSQCQEFATALLDHVRTSLELEVMLNHNPDGEYWDPGERQTLERLKLAIKYKQKQFVAHPNVQQLLAAIWYEGLPGFRRKSIASQLMDVAKLGAMFPVYCTIYMLAPTSKMGKFMKKPFVKFICHSSSYAFFLMLLSLASQRVEFLVIEWFGTPWMKSVLEDWKRRERGSLPGPIEYCIIFYVISLIWCEVRSLWVDGLLEYIGDLWNIVDFITNVFYLIWISLRFTSWYIVQREYLQGKNPWYPREQWDPYDPMLLSEGAFAAGMIFSYMKLVHIFSVNPHLGPLQISLGRMIIDILKFFFIYSLVLFAFGCGMNQLLWYYADLEKRKCYHTPDGLADFDNEDKACSIWRRFANLFETSQSLFWASFGLVDLMAFELKGIKSFTRFWALLMFGSYSVINIIVLLNMLIAMMSNSYQIISERSDREWKFARSHLWMSYFEEGDTVPPPFNMIPTTKTLIKFLGCRKGNTTSGSIMRKSHKKAMDRHETVMHLLVRRYITAETRKRDEFGITEDDVMEIRQDISTLRYELIDILKNNGMRTPKIDKDEVQVPGKKNRVMERRLQKGFQIAFVEGLVTEALTGNKEPKDVFSKIARAIGRRGSSQKKKKDWNAMVRRNTTVRDPIGSSSEAMIRRSRQSLRRHIISEHSTALITMDPEKLVEYNPKLSEVTPATRVAYAKFKVAKIREEFNTNTSENDDAVSDDVFGEGEVNVEPQTKQIPQAETSDISIPRPRPCSRKMIGDEVTKKSCSENKLEDIKNPAVVIDILKTQEHTESSLLVKKDFRARTPIQEEDEEGEVRCDTKWEREKEEEANNKKELKEEEETSNRKKLKEKEEANNQKEVKEEKKEANNRKDEYVKQSPHIEVPLSMKPSGKSKVTGEILTGWL